MIIKEFAVGQLLKKNSFTLYETMSAIEVNYYCFLNIYQKIIVEIIMK